MFSLLRSFHIVFHSGCTSYQQWKVLLAFPPGVYEGSFFSASSPRFVVNGVLDGSYANRNEVEF
jgi:hypothetical protein